jgi:hypothetical protein
MIRTKLGKNQITHRYLEFDITNNFHIERKEA